MTFIRPNRLLDVQSVIVRNPLTIPPDATVMAAVTLMSRMRAVCSLTRASDIDGNALDIKIRASCIFVVEGDRLLGLLTARDVVRLSAQKQVLEQLLIHQVMTLSPTTIPVSDCTDIFTITHLLQQHRIQNLPVLDQNRRIVGLITPESLLQGIAPAHLLRLRSASDGMTTTEICARPQDSMMAITQLMTEHQVSSVVIVQAPDNQPEIPVPLGIVTEQDLVQSQALNLDLENLLAECVMSTPVGLVSPNDSLWSASQVMAQQSTGQVVVIDEAGNLLGSINQTSLVRLLDPMELYSLTQTLEEKVAHPESEKIAILEARVRELELQLEQATGVYMQIEAERDTDGESIGFTLIDINDRKQSQVALEENEERLSLALEATHRRLMGIDRDITDLKRSENILQESERHLSTLISNLPGYVYRVANNRDFTPEFISEGVFLVTGYGQDEYLVDRTISCGQEIHPEDADVVWDTVQRAVEARQSYECEYRLITKSGEQKWVWERGRGIYLENGDLMSLEGFVTDITQRKRIESELRQAVSTNQALLSAIPDLILRVSRDGIYRDAVPTNEVQLLVNRDQLIGKRILDVLPADLAQQRMDVIQQTFQTGQTQLHEYPICINGEWRHEEARSVVCGDDEAMVLIRDVTDRKAAITALAGSQKQFQNLVENSPDIIERFDLDLRHLYVSPSLVALTGIPSEAFLGKTCRDLRMDQIMVDALEAATSRLLSTGQKQVIEFDIPTLAGDRSFEMAIVPEFSERQALESILCISRDITDRKYAKAALQESESRFRQLAETIQDVFWIADLDFPQILYVSPAYETIWGRSCASLYEQPWSFAETIHPEDRDSALSVFQGHRQQGWDLEYRIMHPDGTLRWIWEQAFPVPDATGSIYRIVGICQDITDRKQAESQLLHNSFHDSLTQLPNRNLLMQRLDLAIHRVQRAEAHRFAVLFLDLDRFKVINDSLGHLVGDHLLVAVAQKLQARVRATDLAARLGGDEFVILLEDIVDLQNAVRFAENLLIEFQSPFILERREIFVTTSIGIVLGTSSYSQASDLLRDADNALYQAKAQGKNAYKVFNFQMHTQAIKRLDLENDLRNGLERNEFVIHYQPILTLKTLELVGFEALIRWQHPTLGFISPADFIPLAEETGLIVSLDRWMLKTACQQLVQWQRQFPLTSALTISINLTDQDLRQSSLIAYVDQVLSQTGLRGQSLNLEITEGVLIRDVFKTIEVLTQLQERGIQISIDDFGTGYSSLNYLHQLPLDTLKIDRSFVSPTHEGSRNHQIVQTIITLSNQLGMKVVAEGIETNQQLEWLLNLGCELGQGYFLSRPMDASKIESLLRQGGRAA